MKRVLMILAIGLATAAAPGLAAPTGGHCGGSSARKVLLKNGHCGDPSLGRKVLLQNAGSHCGGSSHANVLQNNH